MGLEDVGDAVAEAEHGHAPAVDLVEERLHLLAMPCIWSIISSTGVPLRRCREMRRQASSVTPCWKLPALAEDSEDLEGLAVLVHGDGHEQAARTPFGASWSCWAGCAAWAASSWSWPASLPPGRAGASGSHSMASILP